MDKLDKKAEIISECSAIFGELKECDCYVPRKFFKKSIKTIMKEFNKGLKQIDGAQKSVVPSEDKKSEKKPVTKTVVVVDSAPVAPDENK